MHVGVILGDIEPQTGGGFTFVNDVVEAFLDLASNSHHRYTLLAPQRYVDAMRGHRLAENIEIKTVYSDSFLDRRVHLLAHYLPIFGYFWRQRSALERRAASLGIDLVWFVGGRQGTFDIPYVTTVWDVQHMTHPWFPEVSAKWTWDHRELFLRRHLRRAMRVIVGTRVGRDEISAFYGIPSDRMAILPHPTPAFALRAANETGARPSSLPPVPKNYIYYPAQFWAHKNHVNLLRSLRILVDEGFNPPTLVLSGSDKGNRAFIERCAADLGITDRILILGFVSVEGLVSLYRNARALVYPSFSGPENLPPLEAFALGCPAIVSNYRGAEEQLGDAAVFFDPADPSSIAKAIASVVGDESLRAQLIERGRKRALQWTGRDFVQGVFRIFDDFEAQRRCWK